MGIFNRTRKSAKSKGPSEASIKLSRTLRDEVVRHYEAGDLDNALSSARRLLELQLRELGETHPDCAIGSKNVEALRAEIVDEAIPPEPINEPAPTPIPTAPVTFQEDGAAFAMLGRILSLQYRGTGDHTCLTDVQITAHKLRERVGRDDLGARPLLESFQALLSMVEQGSALGNEEWIEVHDRIVKEFGRPLARAAASGKIVEGIVGRLDSPVPSTN